MSKDFSHLGTTAFLCYVLHVFCLCVEEDLVGNYEELKRFLYLCISLVKKEIWMAVALSKAWCGSAKIPKSTELSENDEYMQLLDGINGDVKTAISNLRMAVSNATKTAYACIRMAEIIDLSRKINSVLGPPFPTHSKAVTYEKGPEKKKDNSILKLLLAQPPLNTIKIPTIDSYIDQHDKKSALREQKERTERPVESGILRKVLTGEATYSTIYPSPPYSGSSVSVKGKTAEKGKSPASSRYQYAKKSGKPSAGENRPSIGVKTFQKIDEKSSSLIKPSEEVQITETGKAPISETPFLTSSDDSLDNEMTQVDNICGLDIPRTTSLSGSVARASSGKTTSNKPVGKDTGDECQGSPRKKARILEGKSESVSETSSNKKTSDEQAGKDPVEEGQASSSEKKPISEDQPESGAKATSSETSDERAVKDSVEGGQASSSEKPISEGQPESGADSSSSETTSLEMAQKDTVQECQGSPRKKVRFSIAKADPSKSSELKDSSSSKEPSEKGSPSDTPPESST